MCLGHRAYPWYLIHEVVVRVWSVSFPLRRARGWLAVQWLFVLAVTLLAAGTLYALVEHPDEFATPGGEGKLVGFSG